MDPHGCLFCFCVGKPRLHAPYPEPSVTLELYIEGSLLWVVFFYSFKVIIVFEGGGHHHHCLL
jgi:hypothetical protein